jgi:serine/threonine protein phosphatase PrpC
VPGLESIAKIIMTSDGVHEYVSVDEMEQILELDIDEIEQLKLIEAKALENGSTDDISILLTLRPGSE